MSRILITGAGGGIAKAIIPVLHELGHTMLLTTRSRSAELKAFLDEQNIDAPMIAADLTNEAEVNALFSWVEQHGGIDVWSIMLIAHAAAAWKLDAEEMEKLFQINFFSAVRCASKALPAMRANGFGRIINISSVVAHKPSFGTSGYAASKSALEGYARGIAIDVANKGITANTVPTAIWRQECFMMCQRRCSSRLERPFPRGVLAMQAKLAAP